MVQLDGELQQQRERLRLKTQQRLLRRQQARRQNKESNIIDEHSDEEIAEDIVLSPGASKIDEDRLDHQKVVCRRIYQPNKAEKQSPTVRPKDSSLHKSSCKSNDEEILGSQSSHDQPNYQEQQQEENTRRCVERAERAKRAAKKSTKERKKTSRKGIPGGIF